MSRSQPTIFVLWSNNFEEAPAVLFVSELRRVGLRVKVVGLRGLYAPGQHGLALTPDMTLAQALPLAYKASCVVLPCAAKYISQLKNDPRLTDFFQKADANQALFVIGQDELKPGDAARRDLACLGQVLNYPSIETLVNFVREVADELLQRKT